MKVKPIGERVLVRREEAEKTTAGGIILQAESIERPAQGEVIAVGDVESVRLAILLSSGSMQEVIALT